MIGWYWLAMLSKLRNERLVESKLFWFFRVCHQKTDWSLINFHENRGQMLKASSESSIDRLRTTHNSTNIANFWSNLIRFWLNRTLCRLLIVWDATNDEVIQVNCNITIWKFNWVELNNQIHRFIQKLRRTHRRDLLIEIACNYK